jgi:hypothetical protein
LAYYYKSEAAFEIAKTRGFFYLTSLFSVLQLLSTILYTIILQKIATNGLAKGKVVS